MMRNPFAINNGDLDGGNAARAREREKDTTTTTTSRAIAPGCEHGRVGIAGKGRG